jgi:enoyl-CoA hydratase
VAIHYVKDDEHIVLITIDRPEAKNSADMEHFKLLREAWERFDADDDAWVAIITGVGDAFFTGADLKRYIPEITKFQDQVKQGLAIEGDGVPEINGYRMDDGVKAVLRNVELFKPVIAAVNGFCTAGGMEMLGGIDLRIACPEAKFAVMEPKRGLFAGGGTTVRLPRQIPWAQAMEMLLCADLIPAERAYQMGLLNAVVPREQLLDTAYAFARRITENAPLAVQATKRSALQGLYSEEMQVGKVREAVKALSALIETVRPDDPATARFALLAAAEVLEGLGKELRTAFENESRISSTIFRTEDAKEGPRAFAEKRKPNWQAK